MKFIIYNPIYKPRFAWIPRRLTLKHNPAIYTWLGFNFSFDEEVR